jgi:hypothetical protein
MLWEPYDYEGTFGAATYGDANTARRAALDAVRVYLAARPVKAAYRYLRVEALNAADARAFAVELAAHDHPGAADTNVYALLHGGLWESNDVSVDAFESLTNAHAETQIPLRAAYSPRAEARA